MSENLRDNRKRQREAEEDEEKQGGSSNPVASTTAAPTNPTNSRANEAMMNDVILKHMFELVAHRELNTFRQVCSHWYQGSLPAWLKSGPTITLKNFESFVKFVSQVHGFTRDNCPAAVQRINGIQHYPKFHVDHEAEASELLQSPPHHHIITFWKLGGQWLTHLTLRFSGFTLTEIIILSCKLAPKLEHLDVEWKWGTFPSQIASVDGQISTSTMNGVQDDNKNLKEFHIDYTSVEGVQQPSTMEWKSLLGRFPNLEHFHVGIILSFGSGLKKILKAIKEIREDDKDKLKLKSLICHSNEHYKRLGRSCDGYHPREEPSLQAGPDSFRQLGLDELHSFRIDFGADDSDEFVNSILSTWAASLKQLEFYRYALLQNPPFHEMGQLQTLTLAGYPVANLAFLAHLPTLRSLTLWEYCGDYDNLDDDYDSCTIIEATDTPADLICPSLIQFGCNYDAEWDEGVVTRLHQLMPNLTRLACCLFDHSLRLVPQFWPRLEHLCVYGDYVGDFGIEGISALHELRSFEIESLDEFPSLFQQPRNRDLDPATITEVSVNVFLQLARLNKLVIRTHANQLDEETAALIRNEIPFSKVIIDGVEAPAPTG